jgi:hypothetical protein
MCRRELLTPAKEFKSFEQKCRAVLDMNLFISAYPLLVYLLCFALEFNQLVKSGNENNIRAKIRKTKYRPLSKDFQECAPHVS